MSGSYSCSIFTCDFIYPWFSNGILNRDKLGTFGIMLPIAAAMATNSAPELLLPCLSAVMAGAVCGDHCSPVSDTTILSSTGAKCNHMDHVTTQLPYAATVATASAVGYIVVGFTESGLAGFCDNSSCF